MQISSITENSLIPIGSTRAGGGWSGGSKNGRGSRHRGKSKLMEQIDLFLEGMGLYRKQTARDATCLFRTVSEQVFYSQCFHYSVRLSCIHFMERNRNLFPEKIDGEKFEDHARRMRSPREWGGHWEMQAMAILYKKDFIIFNDINTAPVQVTDNNFPDKILLCRIGPNHFDSVFAKAFIDNTAVCQGLIYELLYGQVFGMEDIDTAVQVSTSLRENQARPNSVINVLVKGGTPFPYKVAKALDPRMYRNVEYDLWNDERKELKKNNIFHNEILQIGSKCMVTINDNPNHQYPAYIQDMQPDKGPVTVFVEVLGEMCTVPYDNIEPIVLPLAKTRCLFINGTQLHTQTTQSVRFRRFKPGRIGEKNSTLREITDKIQSSLPKIQSAMDFNNNQAINQTVVLWSHNGNNNSNSNSNSVTNSPESSGSRETHCSMDSTEKSQSVNGPPQVESPYYVVSPPSQPQQWGMYQPIPPCPPPQISYAQQAQHQQQAVQMPTPLYVTFSDGTTMLVPTHRIHDASQQQQQQTPPMMYHYDPSGIPPTASFPPQFGMVGENIDQQLENVGMNLEQQLVLHQDDGYGSSLPSLMQIPTGSLGYWPAEQQQIPHHLLPTGFCPPPPPPHHHMQQQQCGNPPVINAGEMTPMTVFFSSPFPY
ncbi:ovarian tumor-like protein [Daphnia pulex]|uniref:Ovarian tumor-like protein n=1 Tax=Daphnia pulex TaxID=6669 RepID=E9FSN1_DAPPU|nr:ovarian tumor-like protein [Daphnia pulex]|eukprot:EFX89797.1 ovarian tumor-like protein [Daphnia pulex]